MFKKESPVFVKSKLRTLFDTYHLINKEYNFNEYLPIDGSIVEISDIFAAFIEACLSIVIGIKSKELEKGKIASYSKLISKNIGDFDFLPLIDYFL